MCNNEDFKRRMCDIVWTDSIAPETFEIEWKLIMIEFGLTENKLIDDMFGMRSSWIPAFYRHEPMSGLMRTTSRSESENHFFCQVANSQLTLVEFFNHFDGQWTCKDSTIGKMTIFLEIQPQITGLKLPQRMML